jgi:hypothetical protein
MHSVTVIIPAFNASLCLQRCLESVFSQQYLPVQIIVVNDGSTDNTKEIAANYASRIEYFEQENRGPGAARNVGIKVARGDYIAFLDADDYWMPNFLSCCVQFMETHKDAVAVTTGQSIKLWGHPVTIRPIFLEESSCPTAPFVIDNFFSFWTKYNHVVTGASLFRRSVIEKAGYQRTDFRVCEDLEYWGYLATFGKWGFIPEVLWIGDPMPAAASQGWIKRYTLRWQKLPTIELWESRIKPRLKQEDFIGFEEVKSKIAASLVHQNILAGNFKKAKEILLTLENKQKRNRIIKLLNIGNKIGPPGWFAVCKLIQLRERMKAFGIYLSSLRRSK